MVRSIFKSSTSSGKRPTDAELHNMIEKKAYELFLKRGSRQGSPWQDWFDAEQAVKKQHSIM